MEAQITIKMPLNLRQLIEKCVATGMYKDISEFVRAACRDKILIDFPELYQSAFKA